VAIEKRWASGVQLLVNSDCGDEFLIISERPSPYWRIKVNGSDSPWEAINSVMGIKLPIPKGESRISLQFLSPRFSQSLELCFLGIFLIAVGLLVDFPRLSRKTRSSP
jgi:uncharacterized membrane protein YfhO